ncbi:zinc-ribbon domain-containing protein [Pantoea sp. NSTU24]|uniref:YfgJ family double zinc ribbon protein n=1 Tax=Pantoea sp. NSTU24 TaxID=3391144 RepID=UPI003D02EE46
MCERCETCQQPLSLRNGEFICPGCGAHFSAQPCCPTCQALTEVLRACVPADSFWQRAWPDRPCAPAFPLTDSLNSLSTLCRCRANSHFFVAKMLLHRNKRVEYVHSVMYQVVQSCRVVGGVAQFMLFRPTEIHGRGSVYIRFETERCSVPH